MSGCFVLFLMSFFFEFWFLILFWLFVCWCLFVLSAYSMCTPCVPGSQRLQKRAQDLVLELRGNCELPCGN